MGASALLRACTRPTLSAGNKTMTWTCLATTWSASGSLAGRWARSFTSKDRCEEGGEQNACEREGHRGVLRFG